MKPEVRELLADVKRSYEQVIDETTKDRVISGTFELPPDWRTLNLRRQRSPLEGCPHAPTPPT
jgi:hypothetical protein